ncbi:hypothetical protein OEG84_17460 [Hoeflea sp. G2-23]|uniref:Uncharacterized protein n=1 Tax=Hoeflea algicola TaxID=2983763 RepID=A0ABT3ZCB1_9HYPH|nr:hypothetical protein [Hoeflea algicola]MCY0149445.1 hypothetical protein [Hoeflea algicola]
MSEPAQQKAPSAGDLATDAAEAIRFYAKEVRARTFPSPNHLFADEGNSV